MSSPRVGVVRDSMQTNPRIFKSPVGKSKPTCLPDIGPDITFGISSQSRDGGVAEVLSSWGVQKQCRSSSQEVVPDFVSLNRDAVRSGVVTSKKLSQYRGQMGVLMNQSHTPKAKAVRTPQSKLIPPVETFGLKTHRPSSPLSDLLSHQYAQRWINDQLTRSNNHAPPRKTGCVPDTRTSLLRKRATAPGAKSPGFKSHSSDQVPATLDTFRNREVRLQVSRTREGAAGTHLGKSI